MKTFVCLCFFLCITVCEISCQLNQVYIKISKQSSIDSNEESYEIWKDSTKVVTSPTIPDNAFHSAEYCLPSSSQRQYTLKLMDSYGDSWSSGSFISVQGVYGNIVFKNFMHGPLCDTYTLSLYYPIMKNGAWKLTSGTTTGSWMDLSFDDSTWSTVQMGFVSVSVTGTQYLRKSFSGIPNMAAYELDLRYQYGIIVYLNGFEIHRDNMPDGVVSSNTQPTGHYSSLSYHKLIRPANEILISNQIALELHFSVDQETVDFDAFLALLAPSIMDSVCHIYDYSLQVSNMGRIDSVMSSSDFSKSSFAMVGELPSSIVYSVNGPKAYINGLGIWPDSDISHSPQFFVFQGSHSTSTEEWEEILSRSSVNYENQAMAILRSYISVNAFSNYRVMFESSVSDSILVYEMVPLICNTIIPTTIEFSESLYSFYAMYDSIIIQPILSDYTDCEITPLPTNGLTFNSATCTLSGVAIEASNSVNYTVTSFLNGNLQSGSFSIRILTCSGSFLQVLRTYKYYPLFEGFTIYEKNTHDVILSVALYSALQGNSDWSTYLCLVGDQYDVEMHVQGDRWYQQSYLYIRGVLDTDNYETIIRMNRDDGLSMPVTITLNLEYTIPALSNWYYKMGEVPSNWFNNDFAGWTEKPSTGYPDSTNQIQLYKKSFNLFSLDQTAGFVISLKYQYGVIIYVNSHEVFRKGVSGSLSTSSFSSTTLYTLKYHQISLPLSGRYNGGVYTNFIQEGLNTIAIALISLNPTMVVSTFDCALRFMGGEAIIRNFDYTTSSSGGISPNPMNVFDLHSSYSVYSSFCNNNIHFDIVFNNDRREWISSVSLQALPMQSTELPSSFSLLGRNEDGEEWTLIKQYTGLTWSEKGQRNRYWTLATNSYNQYRFGNFSATPCLWQIGSIQLLRDAYSSTIPALSYPATTVFKNVEISEIYPNSDYYTDFAITPALPEGLVIDSITGMISGTMSTTQDPTVYTIQAYKGTGESVECMFTLECIVCTGGKALITLMAHTDSYPNEMHFKLFSGRGTSGEVVKSVEKMRNMNSNNHFDYCLPDGIYTYQFLDKDPDGWMSPAGYYLSVDIGAFKFAVGYVRDAGNSTISFSSYLPFQVNYTEWNVYKALNPVSSNWTVVAFDDSDWISMKASEIGTTEAITTYLRKEVLIESTSDYNLLNVRILYSGGVAAYFNGRRVARFNLDEYYTSLSESFELLPSPTQSKFHIILATSGVMIGKNVVAFEIHRPKGQSSSLPVLFDATGVFDVNDCSFAIDSYAQILGSTTETNGPNIFFDMIPQTKGALPNMVNTYTEWEVDNLDGSRFNALGVASFSSATNWAFSLLGKHIPMDSYSNLFSQSGISITDRMISFFSVPVGIASYSQFKLKYDYAASEAIQLSEYITFYCKASGEGVCPGIDDYPAVTEGQISPGICPDGYRGYSYRMCSEGSLGSIQTDQCMHRLPLNLHYGNDVITLVLNTSIHIVPTYLNIITTFYLGPNIELPNGLVLDDVTGVISGVPSKEGDFNFVIYGKNPSGAVEVAVHLTVRKGECRADGVFPQKLVDETAVYDCSKEGAFIGKQTRMCILGEKDGEWGEITGRCIPILFLVVVGIIVLVILVLLVFICVVIFRRQQKKKLVRQNLIK